MSQIIHSIAAEGGETHRGFSLLELMFVLALTAIGTVLAGKVLVTKAEEQAAEGVGSWMLDVRNAVLAYETKHFDTLKSASESETQLTLATLKTEKLLPDTFPERPPNRIDVGISISVTCTTSPDATCNALGLVYSTAPYVSHFTRDAPRLDLANSALRVMNGHGALSWADSPEFLRGPSLKKHKNPAGKKMGIIAAVALYTPASPPPDSGRREFGATMASEFSGMPTTTISSRQKPGQEGQGSSQADRWSAPREQSHRPAGDQESIPDNGRGQSAQNRVPVTTFNTIHTILGSQAETAGTHTATPDLDCDQDGEHAVDPTDRNRELVCRHGKWRRSRG